MMKYFKEKLISYKYKRVNPIISIVMVIQLFKYGICVFYINVECNYIALYNFMSY